MTAPRPLPARPRRRHAFAAAFGLAALTLVALRVPAYDPTAWLIWGREISAGTLSMVGGPSWKPLPVVFTTLFAYTNAEVAQLLWLLLARMGGFVAVVMAYRVTARLGGRTAGLIAAAGLALGADYLFNVLRGDSEGWLVALCLIALDLHLSGRHRAALVAGLLAGLVRPEVWPLLAAYGLHLLRPRHGRPYTFALLAVGAAGLLVAWFLPDYLATGDWLRGANRARHPVPGSPGQSGFPFGLTFVYATIFLPWPLYAGAVYTVAKRREPVVRTLALAAAGLMLTVAVLAEVGFTGNIRYVTLPMAAVCVLGGLGLPDLAARAPRWTIVPAVIAVLVSVGVIVSGGVRLARDERDLGPRLDAAIAAAGGKWAVRGCGRVATAPFERQRVAYLLALPSKDVWTHAESPGIALVRTGKRLPNTAVLPVRARLPSWAVRARCH